MTTQKKCFEPDFKDLPRAFLTTTKKGKQVYRIYLNLDEILARLEEGKKRMALDIPTRNGYINVMQGKGKTGKPYKSFSYYGWAMEERS